MISRRTFLWGSTLSLLVAPQVVFAQDACAAQSHIVLLSDYVIANRSKMPKLQNRRHGTISAYLKIMYQGLNAEQVEALVQPLVGARVDRARELLLAWRISAFGLEETIANAAPGTGDDIVSGGPGYSLLRAAIRSGEIPAFFDRIAALPPERRVTLEINIVRSVIDMDDQSKSALATEALARKLVVLAGGFVASQEDPAAWPAFVAKLNDPAEANRLAGLLYWLPAVAGNPPLPRPPIDAQGEMARALIHQAMIAATRVPEREYLMNYLNQTGDYEGVGRAAAAIIDLTREGAAIEMETAWLVTYELLAESAGNRSAMDARLKALSAHGTRFGGDNVRQVLDHMLAIEALKLHAGNRGATRPPELEGASADFDSQYKVWQEAAAIIARGGDLAPLRSSGQKLSIAANLLFAAGRQEDLAKFLTSTVPNSDSIRLAELFAAALDRQCSGHLAFPAEALLMPDMPMFKFEPQA